MDDQQDIKNRLERIEEMLARLEWKFEHSSLQTRGTFYSSDLVRYCLENNVDLEYFGSWYARDRSEGRVTKETLKEISDWLAKHEDDPSISFYGLEESLGGRSSRSQALNGFKALLLNGRWTHLVSKMLENNHPIEAKSLAENPYDDERPKNS